MTMDLQQLLDGLVQGYGHSGWLRCARVFQLTPEFFSGLRREVDDLRRSCPASQVTHPNHVTNWTEPAGTVSQYSLLNRSGRTDDFSADHDFSCRRKWFFDAARWPTLGRLIADWPHLVNMRVNVLGQGARLAAHQEYVPFRTIEGNVGARLRFHLPLETNDGAELNLDGDVHRLQPAVIYLVNHGCIHTAANHGPRERVHLVWDALLTDAVAALLLGSVAPPPYAVACGFDQPEAARHQPIGAFRRMAPLVTPLDASALTVCPPQ